MAPPKGKSAAARSNPSAPSLPEEPLDDDNGTSYTPDLEDELARLREALAAAQDRTVTLEQGNPAAAVPPVPAPPVVVAVPPVAAPPAAAPPVVPLPPAVTAPISTRSAPMVNKPAEFNGKLSEYATFISQCLLPFTTYPTAYGEAKQKARDRLGQLEQTKSVAAYAAEFQETVMPLDLEDDSLMSMFYRGLNSGIKETLISFPEAKTFDELLDQCVSIDQRQFALRKEQKTTASRSKAPSNSADGSKPSSNFKKPSHSGTPYSRSGNPSQPNSNSKQTSSRPRGPVSEEERARRQANNLCYRCGSSNHMRIDCPLNKKDVTSSNVYAARPPTPAPEYTLPSPQENWLSQDPKRPTS